MNVKTLLLFFLLLITLGCSKRDLNQPHDAIKAIAFGENGQLLYENKMKFHLSPKVMSLYFDLGSGECERYLEKLNPDVIYEHISVTNNIIKTDHEYINDKLYRFVFLQCEAFHGMDQACEDKRIKDLNELEKVNKAEAAIRNLTTFQSCEIRKPFGKPRFFDYKKSKVWGAH